MLPNLTGEPFEPTWEVTDSHDEQSEPLLSPIFFQSCLDFFFLLVEDLGIEYADENDDLLEGLISSNLSSD